MTTLTAQERHPHYVSRYYYGDMPLINPRELVKRARSKLRNVDFDTVVGIGLSGVPAAALIGSSMGKHILAVRKADDRSNHDNDVWAGSLGERWIFVDDFIGSGATREHAFRQVLRVAARPRDNNFTIVKSVYVGTYSYSKHTWEPSPDGSLPAAPF